MVSWFRPQNQAGFGLSVAPQNRWREVGVGSWRGSKSGLKTSESVMTGGACGTIAKVASEAS
jgi:hypothetical protein